MLFPQDTLFGPLAIRSFICIALIITFSVSAGYCNQSKSPMHEGHIEIEIAQIHSHIKHGRFQKAHAHLQKLALTKHPKALTLLGLLYEYGVGCEKNVEKALQCYEAAAESGLAEAQYELGRLRLSGEASVHDPIKAAKALTAAADSGMASAQHLLGTMYLHGKGVNKNEPEAAKWLRRSALQGMDESKELLKKMPGVSQVEEKTKQAGDGYGEGLQNLSTSWKGYADLVKSVQSVAEAAASGN